MASFSHYTFGKLTLTTIMILSFFHVKIIPKPYVMYNYQLLSILFSITWFYFLFQVTFPLSCNIIKLPKKIMRGDPYAYISANSS